MTKVLVFGTFDGLHEGHLDFFRQALRQAQGKTKEQAYLVAVVGRDSSVKKVKEKLPKYSEQERLKMVKNCGLVDEALLGKEWHDPKYDSYDIIKEIKPDVICLGYDQSQFEDKLKAELKKMNLNTKVKILKPYKPEIYKSSLLNKT